jgi:hypothetical protein
MPAATVFAVAEATAATGKLLWLLPNKLSGVTGHPTLQVTRVKRVALADIASVVAAPEPADALLGSAVCE